jgi:hypothetical protein
MSCKYRNLIGAPRTGIHSVRIADIAVVDTAVTAMAAFGIAKWTKQSFWIVFLILMLIAEISHYFFCVDSTIAKLLFTQASSDSVSEQ